MKWRKRINNHEQNPRMDDIIITGSYAKAAANGSNVGELADANICYANGPVSGRKGNPPGLGVPHPSQKGQS